MKEDRDTLTVLKLLTKGRGLAFAAAATEVPIGRVESIADAHGWPDLGKVSQAVTRLSLDVGVPRIPVREPPPPMQSRPSPTPAALDPRPAPPATGGTPNGIRQGTPPEPTIDELVRACRRSEHKRTQALGPKLTELAEKITAALRAERETAEDKAKREQERAAALAEIKRLEKALAEARAKATAAGAPGGARGGPRTCPECGDELANPQALGAHRRHKHGIRSTNPRSASA